MLIRTELGDIVDTAHIAVYAKGDDNQSVVGCCAQIAVPLVSCEDEAECDDWLRKIWESITYGTVAMDFQKLKESKRRERKRQDKEREK